METLEKSHYKIYLIYLFLSSSRIVPLPTFVAENNQREGNLVIFRHNSS